MADADMAYEQAIRRTFAAPWRVVAFVAVVYVLANLIRVEAPLGGVVPTGAAWLSSSWMKGRQLGVAQHGSLSGSHDSL